MKANVDQSYCLFLIDFGIKVKKKRLATMCRNYEIYLLEVPFVKLKTTIKNYHEQGLHQLELKFLSAISTNFDDNFQSTVKGYIPKNEEQVEVAEWSKASDLYSIG